MGPGMARPLVLPHGPPCYAGPAGPTLTSDWRTPILGWCLDPAPLPSGLVPAPAACPPGSPCPVD
eukprot:2270406-Lingulodinium_polyedra.AAC.1